MTKILMTLLLLLANVCMDAQVVFSESFEGTAFPPVGWTLVPSSASSAYLGKWQKNTRITPMIRSGHASALSSTADDATRCDVFLYTPTIPAHAGWIKVSCWVKLRTTASQARDTFAISYQPNIAGSRPVVMKTISSWTSRDWIHVEFKYKIRVISPFKIAFRNVIAVSPARPDYSFALDDIKIEFL